MTLDDFKQWFVEHRREFEITGNLTIRTLICEHQSRWCPLQRLTDRQSAYAGAASDLGLPAGIIMAAADARSAASLLHGETRELRRFMEETLALP